MSVLSSFINDDYVEKEEPIEKDLMISPFDNEMYVKGIEVALERINTLTKIHDVIKGKDSLSLETIRIINMVNTNSGVNIPIALEAIDSKDKIKEIVKSIIEGIKKIWAAIVKTIEHIMNKLTEMFKNSKNSKKAEKLLSLLEDKNKDIASIDNSKSNVYIERESLLAPLRYMNKELTDTDIFKNIEDLSVIGNKLKTLIDTVEITYVDMHMFMKELNNGSLDSISVKYDKVVEVNKLMFYDGITDFTNALPKVLSKDDLDIIERFSGIEGKDLSQYFYGVLKYFINGGALYFFKKKDTTDLNFQVLASSILNDSNNTKLRLRYVDSDNIVKLYTVLERLSKLFIDIQDEYLKSYNNIKDMHLDIIKIINKCIENSKNSEDADKIKEGFDIVKQLTKSLLRLSVETSKGYALYYESLEYYTNYLVANLEHYKKDTSN